MVSEGPAKKILKTSGEVGKPTIVVMQSKLVQLRCNSP